MQLNRQGNDLRRRLISASCALLGAATAHAQEPPAAATDSAGAESMVIDSALAYYHEGDGRITAIEPIVNLRHDAGDERITSLNLTLDALSGSSPNGALKSRAPQTFASPSGSSLSGSAQTYTTSSGQVTSSGSPVYTIAPGQLPVDPNYHDQRVAAGGDWQLPLSRLARVNVGGKLSWEHDFLSVTGSAAYTRDFNQKNTTLSVGLSDEADLLRPIGGAPVPGSEYALFHKQGNRSKNGVGLVLGATQVFSERWVSQLNLSVDHFRGYLNDPYKIISIIDAAGNPGGYLYEQRPDARTRRSVYLENRFGWRRASTAFSLRYMNDDWGIRSETAQLRVRWWNSQHDRYLEPTARYYRQTAADFYSPWLLTTATQYVDASADERLGAFHATTFGLKYGIKASGSSGSEWNLRLDYYQQVADQQLAAPGVLQGLALYPGLKSLMFQVGYRFSY